MSNHVLVYIFEAGLTEHGQGLFSLPPEEAAKLVSEHKGEYLVPAYSQMNRYVQGSPQWNEARKEIEDKRKAAAPAAVVKPDDPITPTPAPAATAAPAPQPQPDASDSDEASAAPAASGSEPRRRARKESGS